MTNVMIDGKEYVDKDTIKNWGNSGYGNSGDRNSGNWNSGNRNSGYRNSGNWNSGNWNSGDRNSGNWNSGNMNSGYGNSGDRNSGNMNSGYGNSGDRNSGYGNSGNRNSGNRNSGNWNSGDRNSGYLNIDEPYLRIFGKETKLKSKDVGTSKFRIPSYFYFDLTEWVLVSDMTDSEKQKYPEYAITEGFLRVYEYKQAWKKSFDKANKEDVALTLKIPNFNYKMFEKISGITKKMIDAKLNKGDNDDHSEYTI